MKYNKGFTPIIIALIIAGILILSGGIYYSNKYLYGAKKEVKVISLITEKREVPSPESNLKLTSSNIQIGDEDNYIFLSFDNAINGNESLENFKKYLDTKSTVIRINLPEKAVKGADSIPDISDMDSTVRSNIKIDLISYENGKLIGTLKTKAKEAHYWVRDNNNPKCSNGDMMGICVKNLPINIDLTINFEVQVK